MKPKPSNPHVISQERYEQRRGEIRLHMSHFFVPYLTGIYQAFDGDLAAAIILGEISHHNTAPFFSADHHQNEQLQKLQDDVVHWQHMQGCNAYSISCATGIPRETVRRKVAAMKKKGWLEEVPNQGLRFTPACAEHFGADFTLDILSRWLNAARKIESLLAEEPDLPKPAPARPPSTSSKRDPTSTSTLLMTSPAPSPRRCR